MQLKRFKEPSSESIEKNFEVFKKLLERCGERSTTARQLVEHFSERLALAPASSRLQFHSALPGGLVAHSLRVLKNAKKIAGAVGTEINEESLVISCLFHDIGKVGDLENDLYVPETSGWHVDRGMIYKKNEIIRHMSINDRSLWLISHFGVKLSVEEWLAVRLNDGQYTDENSYYKMNEGMLPLLVHQADRLSCEQEKNLYEQGEAVV